MIAAASARRKCSLPCCAPSLLAKKSLSLSRIAQDGGSPFSVMREWSHGKKPRGRGSWAFEIDGPLIELGTELAPDLSASQAFVHGKFLAKLGSGLNEDRERFLRAVIFQPQQVAIGRKFGSGQPCI